MAILLTALLSSVLLRLLLVSLPQIADAVPIGVCYGMMGNNLPPPREVVDLYRAHNIGRMRLYDPNRGALDALRSSNIEVLVGVPNDRLQALANNPGAANAWVSDNIRAYWPAVRFRYIAVGNEVFPGSLAPFVLPAMRNIHNALSSVGLSNQIKVSTAIHMAVLGNSFPPSQGFFRGDLIQYLQPIIGFLASTGSPLLANVYTYFSYRDNPRDISLSYALFTSPSPVVIDGPLKYQNLFDAMVDALYSAMERVGGAGVEIVISESGWPSAGGFGATIGNAQTYNSNLIQHVSGGTPKRPGRPIKTFIFAMFNENQKPGDATERNFGLFYPNKQPVYSINFTPRVEEDELIRYVFDVL